jgi:transposase, IS5 family
MRYCAPDGAFPSSSWIYGKRADKKKIDRHEKFLARMEALIPWVKLMAVIEPFYPKGERG